MIEKDYFTLKATPAELPSLLIDEFSEPHISIEKKSDGVSTFFILWDEAEQKLIQLIEADCFVLVDRFDELLFVRASEMFSLVMAGCIEGMTVEMYNKQFNIPIHSVGIKLSL